MATHPRPKEFKRTLTRTVILPLVLMVALTIVFLLQIQFLMAESRRVEHSDEVIAHAHETLKLLVDMETGLRGYLVTGNSIFLEPYEKAEPEIGPSFQRLENLVGNRPAQLEHLKRIREHHARWQEFAHTAKRMKDEVDDYAAYANQGVGKSLMDKMRVEVASIVKTEEQERDSHRASVRNAVWIVIVTAISITLVLGMGLVIISRRQLGFLSRSYEQALEAERERTKELLQNEKRTTAIVASLPGIVVESLIDPETMERKTNFISAYVEQMFGYSPEEYLQTPNLFFQHVHPEDLADMQNELRSIIKERRTGLIRYRFLAKDGRTVWAESNIVARYDEQGRPVALYGVALDITERVRMEEERRRSEEFNKRIMESSRDCIKVLDLEGRLLYMSPGGQQLLEIEDFGSCANAQWTEFWEGADRQAAVEAVAKAREGEIGGFEGYCPTAKGAPKWWDIIISPITNPQGQVERLLSVSRDITERKQAEEALQESEEKFRQAQKMEAVGQLAGGVAHDFNNLLTAILGYSDLSLRHLTEQDQLHRNVAEIKKAAQRASALTRQLLAFSRKQVMQPKILDLNSVVPDIEKMLCRLLPENIELKTNLRSNSDLISADPGQLEQVIMNLVVNARDAMPDGGSIAIETASVELDKNYSATHFEVRPGRYVMLAVSDTGAGMDRETQRRIFEPFFTTKEKDKGTGLGLATVYGIVKQSSGHIWVYSEPGIGTTFKIYFPLVKGEATTPEATVRGNVMRGSETILLVEDEEIVRELAHDLLQVSGYQVLEAANGDEALRVAGQFTGEIHLLLTDVIMPGLSGRAVAEQLKGIRPSLRVLYMSGYTDDAIAHHGMLETDLSLLEKPFTPDDLIRKVREVIDVKMM